MSDILKAKGNEEFSAKNYEKAAQLYGDAVTLDPQNPVLYSNKAMALIKLSKWLECIEACDKGLKSSPDVKTKVKLLYRRGLAYSKLNDFHNARESYQLSLKLDAENASVLKSIEELKAQESQFKRSHSIEELKSEKKPKTQSNLQRIPIFEVDTLPEEFRDPKSKPSTPKSPSSVNSTLKSRSQSQSQTSAKVQPSTATNLPKYPERPSVYQLVSITKSNNQHRPHAYEYFLSLSPETYKVLFSGGSIDPSIINFILDSIIFKFNHSYISVELTEKIISLLNVISTTPRFSLVGMFIDRNKLDEIKQKLSSEVEAQILETVFKKW